MLRHLLTNRPRIFILYGLLAFYCSYLHYHLIDKEDVPKKIFYHQQIINANVPAPLQYRILPFVIVEGLHRAIHIPIMTGYLLLRFLCTLGAAIAFHYYLKRWFDSIHVMLGVVIFLAYQPITYFHYSMQPNDVSNLLIWILGLTALHDKRYSLSLVLLAIGIVNRETMFILVLAFALVAWRALSWKRYILWIGAHLAIGFSVFWGLRWWFGMRPRYTALYKLPENLSDTMGLVMMVLFLGVLLRFALVDWSRKPLFLRRLIWIMPLFTILHLVVGLVRELRLFTPLLPILIPLALHSKFMVAKNAKIK